MPGRVFAAFQLALADFTHLNGKWTSDVSSLSA
jgi:hypothetical protein